LDYRTEYNSRRRLHSSIVGRMEILVKKTFELQDEEIVAIYNLFEDVFGQKRDIATFRENYSNTPFTYSYHSLLLNDDKQIVGFHSCMPFYYKKNNEQFMVALGIDSMVKKGYRDYFNFRDMIIHCQKRLKEDGCVLRIGFPNDNSYPVLKKGLKHHDIGKLTTYCLIRNVGAMKQNLSGLNYVSRGLSRLQYLCSFLSVGYKQYKFKYYKDRLTFDKVRYKWFGGHYDKVNVKGSDIVYKIEFYNGVNTAFLLDVWPLSRSAFEAAVRYIYSKERKKIDMIIYVGMLPFTPISLLTVPHRFEPKRFNFTCQPLIEDFFDDSLYDIRNWDVNLSSYDLL